MTDGRRAVLWVCAGLYSLIAAAAVLGAFPRSFDGSGGGAWIAGSGNMVFAIVVGFVAAVHYWIAAGESRAAGAATSVVSIIGILSGLVLLSGVAPLGGLMIAAYGFVLTGSSTGGVGRGGEELQARLRSRR